MVPGSGVLQIKDAEEPFLLTSPTHVNGATYDPANGVIAGGTLVTPVAEFEVPLPAYGVTAQVKATFTQATPGSLTGLLGPSNDPQLIINTALDVELQVDVEEAGISSVCRTSAPVGLQLSSSQPYDTTTNRVTITDPDFTVPTMVHDGDHGPCFPIVEGNINNLLNKAGHSITMTVEGEMTPPPAGDTANTTTLTVAPAGSSPLGNPVTLTAAVASDDPEQSEAPTGNVTFLSGSKVVGLAPLTAGTGEAPCPTSAPCAILTTSSLKLGSHPLAAQYSGDGLYTSSTSVIVNHVVTAAPTVSADFPSFFTIGAAPVTFDLTTDNPSVGTAVNNARVDVVIQRFHLNGYSGDPLGNDNLKLEVESSPGTWTQIPLTDILTPGATGLPGMKGSIWPSTGIALPPGASITDHLRLSFFNPAIGNTTVPGKIDVTFNIFRVDPTTGVIVDDDATKDVPVAATTSRVDLFEPGRIESYVDIQELWVGEALQPSVVRQHGTITMPRVTVGPPRGSHNPTGTLRVSIDGVPVRAFGSHPGDLTKESSFDTEISFSDGGNTLMVDLPPNVAPGPHTLTVAYSGDAHYTPSSASEQFTVVEPLNDRPYTCDAPILSDNRRFRIQVKSSARVPSAVTSPSLVQLEDFSFEIVPDRGIAAYYAFWFAIAPEVGAVFEDLTLDLGAGGSVSVTGATIDPSNDYPGGPAHADDTDFSVSFSDEEATVSVAGQPGDVFTPAIHSIRVQGRLDYDPPIPMDIQCVPVDQPFEFSPITVAGTTLDVDAPDPTRADDEVALTASVFPSTGTGTVRFSDGDTLLDIARVQNGKAVTTVTLPEGSHSLTARFFAGISAPSTTSLPVSLSVLAAIECDDFTDDGNGAAVRLVYLELLRRCPDQAGYDYWVGALDDGVSREQFARRISASLEAREVIVDDAYQLMLGRRAEPSGREFWARRLANGRYDTLLADLAASSEFRALAGGTNEGFVDRVYERLLGRSADSDGKWYWMVRLNSGVSRRQLVVTLANLAEPLSVAVRAAYDDLIGRSPSSSELADGVAGLRSRSDRSALYASLIGTSAFFARAQELPNPED